MIPAWICTEVLLQGSELEHLTSLPKNKPIFILTNETTTPLCNKDQDKFPGWSRSTVLLQ